MKRYMHGRLAALLIAMALLVGIQLSNAQESITVGRSTIGLKAGEDAAEGQVDFLIPIHMTGSGDGLFFINPRSTHNDIGESEINLGIGFRQLVEKYGIILGANLFYDARWPGEGQQFNQAGVGIELLSEWVDARGNYYIPEDSTRLIDSSETTTLLGTVYDHEYHLNGLKNTIVETRTTTATSTYRTDLYELFMGTLEGYDAEIGVKLPLPFENAEIRLFGGYYSFAANLDIEDVEGLKGRLEVRALPILTVDIELYEDDRLFGSDFMVGARVNLPFDVGNIAEGENPFAGTAEMIKKAKPSLMDRMVENIMRDPHIQLRTKEEVTTTETVEEIRSQRNKLLELDVVFVDSLNGRPLGRGTAEDPTDTIPRGLAIADANSSAIVFVLTGAGVYSVPVAVDQNIRLIGQGMALGTRGVHMGRGIHPAVHAAGSPVTFDIGSAGPLTDVSLMGFDIKGDIAGVLAQDVENFDFSFNILRDSPVGMAYISTPAAANNFTVVADNNTIQNVGAGLAVGSLGNDGTVAMHGNSVERSGIGVLVGNVGSGSTVDAFLTGNKVRGEGYFDLDSSGTRDALGLLGFGIPAPFDLPHVAGLLALTAGDAKMNATISGNDIDGSLLGIGAVALDARMRADIFGNTISAGSLGAGIQLLDEAILGFGLPTLDFDDMGLAGIGLVSIGSDGNLKAQVHGNTISDGVAGLLSLGIADSISVHDVYDNEFDNNLIGSAGVALFGATVRLRHKDNNIAGAGVVDILEGLLGPAPAGIVDFGIAGIAGVSFGTDSKLVVGVDGDNISGNAVGVLGLNIDEATWRGDVSGATITGGGGQFLAEFISGGSVTLPKDVGLAGVLVVDLYGDKTDIDVMDNTTIDSHLVGAGLIAVGSNPFTPQDKLLVENSTLKDNVLGTAAVGVDGATVRADILGNTITGGPELGLGLPVPIGAGIFSMSEGSGSKVKTYATGNTISGNASFGIWGMGSNPLTQDEGTLKMWLDDNIITGNGTVGLVAETHGDSKIVIESFTGNTVTGNDTAGIIAGLGLPPKFNTSVGVMIQLDNSRIKMNGPIAGNTLDGKVVVYEDIPGRVTGVPPSVQVDAPGLFPFMPWWPTP